ncbi:translation initiation factor IF-2-like [Falco biarmicus]|uniref:translation initiation factor IF-2-like n=1 Tax=Falco biarmicus TaxID=345155 RepID=UPI0024BD3079|nr:translation initiation factor IF-2-like [Falco biarmicus]
MDSEDTETFLSTLALEGEKLTVLRSVQSAKRRGAPSPSRLSLPARELLHRAGLSRVLGTSLPVRSRGAAPLPLFAKSKHPGVACPWACACPLAPPAPAAPVAPVRPRTRAATRRSPSPQLPLLISRTPAGRSPHACAVTRGGCRSLGSPRALPLRALPGGRRRDAAPRPSEGGGLRIAAVTPRSPWGPASGARRGGVTSAAGGRRGAGGLRLSARRPETRPRGGRSGGAPRRVTSPAGRRGASVAPGSAARLCPGPPGYLLLLLSSTPRRSSGERSRVPRRPRGPPARGDTAGRRGASRVGGGTCGGGGGRFPLAAVRSARAEGGCWGRTRVRGAAPRGALAVPGAGGRSGAAEGRGRAGGTPRR